MTTILVTYDGEQWRNGGNTSPHSLTFDYRVGPSVALTDPGYTAESSLDFTGPIATATAAALDGNNPANRVAGIFAKVKVGSWAPAEQLMLRWSDINDTGNDHGLAIDNFSFSAIPEPSSTAAIAVLSLMGAAF